MVSHGAHRRCSRKHVESIWDATANASEPVPMPVRVPVPMPVRVPVPKPVQMPMRVPLPLPMP
eukprot:7848371-Karenia_brevis.AAC.1